MLMKYPGTNETQACDAIEWNKREWKTGVAELWLGKVRKEKWGRRAM